MDDASTDKSLEVINNWIEDNKNSVLKEDLITWTSLPEKSGFEEAVSFGLFLAKGEFIACQYSDVVSHPKRIEQQVKFLIENHEEKSIDSNYSSFGPIIFRGELFDKFGDLTRILLGKK